MLTATFVRKRGLRDHVYVVRGDTTAVDWAFPSYGDGLPHDLCHLVVENELGLGDGFWGLIDQHVDVRLVDNQATLVRHGRPLAEEPGIDLSGLSRAERAVAVLTSPFADVDAAGEFAPAERVTAITERLGELGHRWRSLDDARSIILAFSVGGRRLESG